MHVEIVNGKLVCTIPLQNPTPSSTGKTLLVATCGTWQPTTAQVNGKPVSVMIHASIPAK
jgi:hypothetical protein